MSDIENITDLLKPLVEQRIKDYCGEIQDAYKQISNVLTAPNFGNSFSGLKFSGKKANAL